MADTPEQVALERIEEIIKTGSTELNLSRLKLTTLPSQLWKLTGLTSLDISRNKLTAIPSEIGQLVNLTLLDINGNDINELPASIRQLKNLRVLYLHANKFTKLPREICELKKIETLYLCYNYFNSFPEEVFSFDNLEMLDISYNEITEIPPQISRLTRLTWLDAGRNQLTKLPPEIGALSNLVSLALVENQISVLPPEIGQLIKLEDINLNINKLETLPREIQKLTKLESIMVFSNPLRIPMPKEILNAFHARTLLNYYFAVEESALNSTGIKVRSMTEAKLIIVGQGSVGKTSLIYRMLTDEFNSAQDKTEGVDVEILSDMVLAGQAPPNVKIDRSLANDDYSSVRIRIWDFGGQEIMLATHQFFLTKRSLYLLVLDSRLTQEENRVEYWLKIIQSFGGESPVLIVGNKIDQHPLDIDRTGLQKKYPNIVSILETSAVSGVGIEELKTAIIKHINRLPHMRELLPESWFIIKHKLEELKKDSSFITYDKYLELCAENEVSDETSQRTLIGFLHDLGVVLHFQDDPRLEALGILNPQWVTNGVYKILNSHTLFQNKGVLTVSMLDEILNLPEYPRGKRLFIVDMMKKFELCYDIEADKTFLVPDLLPKDEPAELKFNGIPAFEYAYPVLPSSVITRFIVRMNQKIDDGLVWRTGVVLKIGENKALVKADIEDRKITIAIDGMEHTRRETLTAIFYHLNDIHDSIKGLNPEKLVPVPGAENAKPISYNYLLMLEAKGIEILPVPDNNRLIDVNIRKVLSGVPNENQDKSGMGVNNVTNIIVGGNFEGNLMVGDKNHVIQNSYNKIKSADIPPELKETMKQLAEAVDAMIQKLPAEQAAEVAEDFGKLADEAVKPKPNQKWYSVSIEGLIKAAENLDKLGTPVISLSRKVLSLLTGGVVK